MPKRTRDSEIKPSRPVSALAARRQAQVQQKSVEVSPKPKARYAKDTIVKTGSEDGSDAENEEVERIGKARREIEHKVAQRVTELSTKVDTASSVDGIEDYGNSDSERAGGVEESALARVRRKRSEEMLRAVEDEDVEMRSADGSEFGQDAHTGINLAVVSGGESSAPQITSVSNFIPTASNILYNGTSWVFRLRTSETLVLVGEYAITITKGTVTIAGATLSTSSGVQTIFAPTTHALPVIEVAKTEPRRTSKERRGDEIEYDAEFSVTNGHSGLGSVGKLCPLFGSTWIAPAAAPSEKVTGATFHPIYSTTQPTPTISIPPAWQTALTRLTTTVADQSSPPIVLICGSKGTGKSTFSRLLTNSFLSTSSSISYLDVDPGQPEFSPPGVISLSLINKPVLGPPFTHNTLSSGLRSHHIGYVSPRDDPAYYINAVLDLLSYHRETRPQAPLVINTAGWTKGLGLELLQELLQNFNATDVIYLGSPNPLAEILPQGTLIRLHELPAAPSTASKYSPAELRTLATMAYFHSTGSASWNFDTPLTGIPPWTVGLGEGIEAVCILDAQLLLKEEISTALDGTIVGITLVNAAELPEADSLLLQTPPRADGSKTTGLAVIRAIDIDKKIVQLVMPGCIAEDVMDGWEREGLSVVLVRGRLELPVWEMLMPDGGVEVPWVVVGGGNRKAKGGEVWRVRRNLMRRGQQGGV